MQSIMAAERCRNKKSEEPKGLKRADGSFPFEKRRIFERNGVF